jgi:hypothetical protein
MAAVPVAGTVATEESTPKSISDDKCKRDLWLKGCLVLEACAKGARPYVGIVMQKLLIAVVENVKRDVARDIGPDEVTESQWDCSTCSDAADIKFTEEGPVSLGIRAIDAYGVVDGVVPHCLKPHSVKCCRLKNFRVLADSFSGLHADLDKVPLRMFPENSNSTKFLISHDNRLDPSSCAAVLTPFLAVRCVPEEPPLEFHVILCRSRAGHTAELVRKKTPHSNSDDPSFSFRLWSIIKRDSRFSEFRHGMKQGQIVRFSDLITASELPPWIMLGCRYYVTESSNFSFDICGPIVCPLSPWPLEPVLDMYQPLLMMTSPIAR